MIAIMLVAPSPLQAQNQREPARVEPSLALEATAETRFDGRYRFVSGRADVRRAVDAVCDRLDFLTRAFARPILSDRNQPFEVVELGVADGVASFTLGAWGPVRTRLGATRAVRNERGETVHVQQILRNGRLVQTLTTDQGTRRNVLALSADGATLTLDTVITSPRLPVPLRYRLVYRRDIH